MTTIGYRDGVLACDSQESQMDEAAGEIAFYHTQKIYRKRLKVNKKLLRVKAYDVLIATRGEVGAGMVGFDWYGTGKPIPDWLSNECQFDLLIVEPKGLFCMDQYFRPLKINEEYYAIGSGAKAALGAMYMGATAIEAVEAAIQCDPGTGGDIVAESL